MRDNVIKHAVNIMHKHVVLSHPAKLTVELHW